MRELGTPQSNAITLIRIIAMMLIISCHITQGYNQPIAFILNVGVQIFFLISGFLYGVMDIPSAIAFYKKRLMKIYVPYIIVVLLFSSIYYLFGIADISWKLLIPYTLNLQAFITPIEGFNHMWFLSVLMIAYLITPVAKSLLKNKPWIFIALQVIGSIIEFVFIQKMYSLAAWIVLYLFGMCMGHFNINKLNVAVILTSGIGLGVLLAFFNLDRLTDPTWAHYNVCLHVVLAIFIFSTLYAILPKLNLSLPTWLQWINSISYEVYLIHHIWILGPLSLLFITPSYTIN